MKVTNRKTGEVGYLTTIVREKSRTVVIAIIKDGEGVGDDTILGEYDTLEGAYAHWEDRRLNREIRFRVWDAGNKRYLDPMRPISIDIPGDFSENLSAGQQYVWEQFTGLFAKSGDAIYEGDIVQTASGERRVSWNIKLAKFELLDEDGKPDTDEETKGWNVIQVIGTIHQERNRSWRGI